MAKRITIKQREEEAHLLGSYIKKVFGELIPVHTIGEVEGVPGIYDSWSIYGLLRMDKSIQLKVLIPGYQAEALLCTLIYKNVKSLHPEYGELRSVLREAIRYSGDSFEYSMWLNRAWAHLNKVVVHKRLESLQNGEL